MKILSPVLRIWVVVAPKFVHPPVTVDRMRREVCAVSIYVPTPSAQVKQCLLELVDVGVLQVKAYVAVAYCIDGIGRVPQHLHAAGKESISTRRVVAVPVFPRGESNMTAFAPVNRRSSEEAAPQGVVFYAFKSD